MIFGGARPSRVASRSPLPRTRTAEGLHFIRRKESERDILLFIELNFIASAESNFPNEII